MDSLNTTIWEVVLKKLLALKFNVKLCNPHYLLPFRIKLLNTLLDYGQSSVLIAVLLQKPIFKFIDTDYVLRKIGGESKHLSLNLKNYSKKSACNWMIQRQCCFYKTVFLKKYRTSFFKQHETCIFRVMLSLRQYQFLITMSI